MKNKKNNVKRCWLHGIYHTMYTDCPVCYPEVMDAKPKAKKKKK